MNAFQPHKNLPRVLQAFDLLTTEFPDLELRIAGRPQENFARNTDLENLSSHPRVRLLGFVSDEALAREYASCSVFCFPSLAEGFGLPVLEAAAAGTIVVSSNTTCLPEITGGSALLVDPLSVAEIAAALRHALTMSATERASWIARGRANLHRFEETAIVRDYEYVFSSLAQPSARERTAAAGARPISTIKA